MGKSNLAQLQAALSASGKPPGQEPGTASSTTGETYMAPSRAGKVNITAYLSPDFKSSLRLVQARTGKSLQDIIAEALNDIFQKYDVPTIHKN